MTRDLSRYFSKEDIQMANRCMKKFSVSLIIREIQIKGTVDISSLVRMIMIKEARNNKSWQLCGLTVTFVHFWWEYKLKYSLWKTKWRFLKNQTRTIIEFSNPILRHIFKGNEIVFYKVICTFLFIAVCS